MLFQLQASLHRDVFYLLCHLFHFVFNSHVPASRLQLLSLFVMCWMEIVVCENRAFIYGKVQGRRIEFSEGFVYTQPCVSSSRRIEWEHWVSWYLHLPFALTFSWVHYPFKDYSVVRGVPNGETGF